MELIESPLFWTAFLKIVWVNILLSGDNAVVIALAARKLPPKQQKGAVLLGSLGAIVLRVVLTVFAVQLLEYPYLKLVGSLLLVWIGVSLLATGDDGEEDINQADSLIGAVRTILVADLVMSLDNVIAVAAAAESGPPEGKLMLLILGLGLSIPLIIFGSTLVLHLMERYPIIVTLGACLLGFVAGEMFVTDAAAQSWFGTEKSVQYIAGAIGAVLVLAIGKWRARTAPAEERTVL